MQSSSRDFFISYTSTDQKWAEWIAWQLEEAGYSTILQAWDFRPGANFVGEMNRASQIAARTIAVLSPDYVNARYPLSEWAVAFRQDPTAERGILVPVRVRSCDVTGLLGNLVYIDLVDLDTWQAQERLLAGVQHGRAKPTQTPTFPAGTPRFPGALPAIWMVPFQHNAIFTAREDVLASLHHMLSEEKAAAVTRSCALSGFGGIGKTQTVVEYAYRHHQDYEAVFWIRADTPETILVDFQKIAAELGLLPQEEKAQEHFNTVQVVKEWLEKNGKWLFILDNVDNIDMVRNFLPSRGSGRILITTRIRAWGDLAQSIEMDILEPEKGALFLLRRAHLIKSDEPLTHASANDQEHAKTLSETLGGLPLALDQAGAYIEETGCSIQDYLTRYQTRRVNLLQRRGNQAFNHSESVTTTLSLSFKNIEETNPAAADLLRLCAFLHPDAIPEEIITKGTPGLIQQLQPAAADPFEMDTIIEALLKYSLIRRNPTRTLTVHRLLQVVLKDGMSKNMQRQWAECAVQAVSNVPVLLDRIPSDSDTDPEARLQKFMSLLHGSQIEGQEGYLASSIGGMWVFKSEIDSLLQLYLPQAHACAVLIDEWSMTSPEAMHLLAQTGSFLYLHRRYLAAKPFYEQLVTIYKRMLGREHLDVVPYLNVLALIYRHLALSDRRWYTEAESLYQEMQSIYESQLGLEDPQLVQILMDHAWFLRRTKQWSEAARLDTRARRIRGKLEESERKGWTERGDLLQRCLILIHSFPFLLPVPFGVFGIPIVLGILLQSWWAFGGSLLVVLFQYLISYIGRYTHLKPSWLNTLAGREWVGHGLVWYAIPVLLGGLCGFAGWRLGSLIVSSVHHDDFIVLSLLYILPIFLVVAGFFVGFLSTALAAIYPRLSYGNDLLYYCEIFYGYTMFVLPASLGIMLQSWWVFGGAFLSIFVLVTILAFAWKTNAESWRGILSVLFGVAWGIFGWFLSLHIISWIHLDFLTTLLPYIFAPLISFLAGLFYYFFAYYALDATFFDSESDTPSGKVILENEVELETPYRAIEDFDRAIEFESENALPYYNRGVAYTELKEYQRAIEDFDRAIEFEPENALLYNNRGFAHLWLVNTRQAKDDYSRAWKLDGTDINAAWMAEWIAMGKERTGIETAARLEEIASTNPEDYVAHVCRGVASGLRNKLKEGLAELEKATSLALEPEWWDAYFWKAMLCACLGQNLVAMEAFEKALEMDLPPILLTPLYWLEKDRPNFFSEYAAPLLARYNV